MTKKNFIIFTLSALLLLGFFFLTIAAKYDLTTKIDFDTTVKIQDRMPQRLKPYLIKFVELGNWQIMSILVFTSMLIHQKHFWKIGILYLLIVAIEIYGKYALLHPPPPQFMTLRFQHLDVPKYYVREAASYPSGHAARSAFLVFIWIPYIFNAAMDYIQRHIKQAKLVTDTSNYHSTTTNFSIKLPLGFILTREQGLSFQIADFIRIAFFIGIFTILLSFTFLVGFAKIYLGEHWLSDVVGGWLLGTGLGIFSNTHLKRIANK